MTIGYVAMRDQIFVCQGDELSSEWETRQTLGGYRIECVGGSPAKPDRVFVGTVENGILRSQNCGDTFDRLDTAFGIDEPETDGTDERAAGDANGVGSDRVTAITVSPHDPDVVYAGTEPSRVYRSIDGGDSWIHLDGIVDLPSEPEWFFPPRPQTHHVRWLEVDPFDPDRLYVGIEAGAFVYTTDGGGTWHERPPGSRRDNHSLAAHPYREGRLYAAAGDGYAESDDGGESWRHPQEGLDHRYCWSVVPDRNDPDRVLVSSSRGARTAHTADRADSYVYRKPGPDEGWERLDDRGLPMGEGVVRAVLAAGPDGEAVYAVNNRGLFVTDDFGDSWERVPIEWDEAFESATPRGFVVIAG